MGGDIALASRAVTGHGLTKGTMACIGVKRGFGCTRLGVPLGYSRHAFA